MNNAPYILKKKFHLNTSSIKLIHFSAFPLCIINFFLQISAKQIEQLYSRPFLSEEPLMIIFKDITSIKLLTLMLRYIRKYEGISIFMYNEPLVLNLTLQFLQFPIKTIRISNLIIKIKINIHLKNKNIWKKEINTSSTKKFTSWKWCS